MWRHSWVSEKRYVTMDDVFAYAVTDDHTPQVMITLYRGNYGDNETGRHLGNQTVTEGSGGGAYEGGYWLDHFNVWYQGVHGYLSASCCLLGIVSNVLNIVVLTRKSMVRILT